MVYSDKEVFTSVVKSFIKRDGIDSLMLWLEADTDFYTAPCSTRFHLSREGGLCRHSLNVYTIFSALVHNSSLNKTPEDTIAIVSLFHDLCKINTYKKQMKWEKDENNEWKQVEKYVFDEDYPFGHSEKSIYLLQKFIPITDYEAQAMDAHMGFSDARGFQLIGNIFEKNKLAVLLHCADLEATYIKEKE